MRRKSRASKAAGLQLGCCSVIERGPLATLQDKQWQGIPASELKNRTDSNNVTKTD